MAQKSLKRYITGFEATRTPDISILNVEMVFGNSGDKVVNLPSTFIKELTVFENMRYLCDHVQFVFNDRTALLPEVLPFNGNEKIIVEYGQDVYKTKKSSYEKDNDRITRYGVYDIFKTNFVNTDLTNPTNWQMEFYLINTLAKSLFDQTHCRTFKDMTISDIIRRLIEPCKSDYIKDGDLNIDIEDTTEKGTFTQPMGWTNAQMINYLVELAGDFVFMIYGTNIVFRSVSSLMSVPKPTETVWISHSEYNNRLSDMKHLILIDSKFHLNNYFFETIGARGLTMKGYNFDEKRVLSSYSTIPSQQPLAFGEKFPLTEESVSHMGRLKTTGLKDDRFLANKAKYKNIIPFMGIISSYVITMGRANRKPGDVIEAVYKTAEPDKKLFNTVYSGEWLITAITHTFRGQASGYFQKLELRRNAYGEGAANLITPEKVKKTVDTIQKIGKKMKGV